MNLYFLTYVFLCIQIAITLGSTASKRKVAAVRTSSRVIEPIAHHDTRIDKLKTKGKDYMLKKEFRRAAQCYTAVLQLLEGVGGTKSEEIRRKCGIILAECEIKLGRLHQAVARCSEVINEAPGIDISTSINSSSQRSDLNNNNSIHVAVGKALYTRGVALNRLHKPMLALLDFKSSLNFSPDSEKTLYEILSLETASPSDDEKNEDIFIPHDQRKSDEDYQEELLDLIEDTMSNYPRAIFTEGQINGLLVATPTQQVSPFGGSSQGGLGDLSSLFGGSGGSGAGSAAAGLGGGLGGLGGGLGGLSSLLGPLAGMAGSGGGGAGGLLSLLPALLSMSGVDAGTITQITDIVKAAGDAFSFFKGIFTTIIAQKKIIILVLTGVWVLVSLVSPIFPNIKLPSFHLF